MLLGTNPVLLWIGQWSALCSAVIAAGRFSQRLILVSSYSVLIFAPSKSSEICFDVFRFMMNTLITNLDGLKNVILGTHLLWSLCPEALFGDCV